MVGYSEPTAHSYSSTISQLEAQNATLKELNLCISDRMLALEQTYQRQLKEKKDDFDKVIAKTKALCQDKAEKYRVDLLKQTNETIAEVFGKQLGLEVAPTDDVQASI